MSIYPRLDSTNSDSILVFPGKLTASHLDPPNVLIRSTDNGQTFAPVTTPTKGPTVKPDIEQFLFGPDGQVLALDGNGGLINLTPGEPPAIINSDQTGNTIAGNPNAIFVGENANVPGHASPLRISLDRGKTFQDSLPQIGNVVGVGTNAEGKVVAEFFSLFFDIFTALSPDGGKTWQRSNYFAFQVPAQSSKVRAPPIAFNGSTLLMGGAAAENGYFCLFPDLANIGPASCSRVADTFSD